MSPLGEAGKRLLHGAADASSISYAGDRFLEGHRAVVPGRLRRGRGGALGLIGPFGHHVVARSQRGRPRAEPGELRRARRRGDRRRVPPASVGGSAGGGVVHGRSSMQHLGMISHVDRSNKLAAPFLGLMLAYVCETMGRERVCGECLLSLLGCASCREGKADESS
jgi:hypothetical protein